MTVFVVLMPDEEQPRLEEVITREYPDDHLKVGSKQWLISSPGTAIDISAKLGIHDPKNPTAGISGSAIVFATSSYYGRAPTAIWDWIKAKLESSVG